MRPAARHSLPKQPAKRLSRFVSPALSDLICEKNFQFVQLERQCARRLHASFAPSKIRFQRERERERINSRLEIECLQMDWFIHWTIVSKFADNYFDSFILSSASFRYNIDTRFISLRNKNHNWSNNPSQHLEWFSIWLGKDRLTLENEIRFVSGRKILGNF